MAKEYKIGERYYLPVTVKDGIGTSYNYPIVLEFVDCEGRDTTDTICIADEPDLLLTAEEVAEECKDKAQRKIETLTKQLEEANETIKAFSESENIVRTNFDAKVDENKELKSRNAELEALLKEVMATRDEAIKQNNELVAENKKLKADCNEWKDTANERLNAVQTLSAERNKVMAVVDELKNTLVDRTNDVQHLTEENDKLKAELDQRNKDFDAMKKDRDNILADSKRTTEWYMEANRTATEAAEANDDLKAKIAELRDEVATLKAERCSLNGQVGKNLAEIQALSSDVHFFKEACKKQKAECDELKGRYDELDSVNKEQAEKIRKLDAHNVYLKGLLSAKKKMRIVLNNGNMYDVEVGDKVHPVYDMNNNLFFVKTEGGTVTSFLIGKEPGNIAGWYFV